MLETASRLPADDVQFLRVPATNQRTEYGYYIRNTGAVTFAGALAWSRDLMARVRADGAAVFDVLVDLRGQEPYDGRVADVVRRTMAWCREHGARRSAVVSDDPRILLLTRVSARAVPGAYATERYFNALHGTTWADDARRWLADGEERPATRADDVSAELLALLDALGQPLALFDLTGSFVRASPALRSHVASNAALQTATNGLCADLLVADPLGAALTRAARTFAAQAVVVPHPEPMAIEVVLPCGVRWRVEARLAPEGLLGAAPLVLVAAAPIFTRPLGGTELAARYGVTAREMQVARLAAEGLSNPAIAERLGTQRSTARNQVSSVLRKLGVANRTALSALLLRGEV